LTLTHARYTGASRRVTDIVRRLIFDHTDDANQEDAYRITLPWWSFVALRNQLLEIFL
jgi:hypothetical protein